MKTKRIWALAGAVAVVMLVVGVLILPVSGATSSRQDGCFPVHEVQPDETLDSIAQLYGVAIPDLLAANELAEGVELHAGQQLCIPTAVGEAVQAPAVEATGATTVTLMVEAATPAVEALSVQGQSAVATLICVEGQVIDKSDKGLEEVTVNAEGKIASGTSTLTAKTDKKGHFGFTNLEAGQWTFGVVVPDSWKAVTKPQIVAELGYERSGCYEIRFKLDPRGCILVNKTVEAATAGAVITPAGWLITASGPIDAEPVVTNADGVARIGDLIPGSYLVSEKPGDELEPPWIWTPVTPAEVSVQVKAARSQDDCAAVTFKNKELETSCITGFKVDDNHKPIAGWKVYAEPADDEGPSLSTTTDGNGMFSFPNLPLGTWTVWEEVPPYWTSITPSKFSVTLDKPSDSLGCVVVRFKNRPPDLCAEGYKVDENGEGLEGWTIEAYAVSNKAEVLTATTDEDGYYRFNGLTLGDWVFKEIKGEDQKGWTPITPETVTVNMVGDDCCTQVPIFRNHSPLGCIEGFKIDDQGFGLAGWNITLKPESGGPAQHVLTDGTGHYLFDELPMGKYEVYEELQPGWRPTKPTKYEIDLMPKEPDPNGQKVCDSVPTFENKQVPRDICIDGHKFDVVDGVGLPGWSVDAKNLATGKMEPTQTTDGLGYFRFSNLQPGEYQVTVDDKDKEGWVQVGPASWTVEVTWPPKDACVSVEFYNRQEGTRPPDGPDGPGHDGCRAIHTVCFGDTLNKIAEWEDTSVHGILRVNHIDDADLIYPGQELCIP